MTYSTYFKARAKTAWRTIKGYLKQTTGVISDMLGTFSPQWVRSAAKWKSYRPGKKVIAVCIIAGLGVAAWKFSVDVTRLAFGSYRAASVYARGGEVTKSEIAYALSKTASTENVEELKAVIDGLNKRVSTLEQKKPPAPAVAGSSKKKLK